MLKIELEFQKMKIKNIILLLITASISLFAQVDRSIQPKPGPAPEIQLGDYKSFELENGLKVFVIENNKLPKVSFSLITVSNPIFEGENAGYISLTGELLRRGTKTRTKEQIDEEVDFIGASLNTSGTGVSGSALKKHFDKLMSIFADVVINSEFKQDELDKLKKQLISGLTADKDDPNAIARNLRSVLVYGNDHPYGEVITEKTIESITLEKCQNYYENNLRPNISLLALVGDITVEEAKEMVENYLGSWERKEVASTELKNPQPPLVRKVAVSDRPVSVQSVINIAYPVDLKVGSEDAIKTSVMNTLLGGSFSSRLNKNLREDKGYTYGAGASLSPNRFIGSFTASTTVRNSVTDSAITEIFSEMKSLRNEKVTEDELSRIKNYLTGSFSRALEQPGTIARFALNMETNNLPKDYYKNYLKNLNSVTADDVQEMAKKYLLPNKSHVIVVGNAEEIASGLKKFSTSGKIQYYDNYGVEYDPNLKKIPENITAETIIQKYIDVIGGKEKLSQIKDKTQILKGATQGMEMTLTITQKVPDKLFQELDFSVGKQSTVFDGEKAKIEGMGQLQYLEGEQLEELKYQAKLNPFLDYEKNNVKLELKGIETINDKESYKMLLTLSNGKKYTHYFDVETGYKIREISELSTPQGSFTQTLDLEDYKEVDGIRFPFKLVQKVGPQTIELVVESIKINSNLNDTMFKVD
jgi:predicted Zn-dependent peptidase